MTISRRQFIATSAASGLVGPLGLWSRESSAQQTKPRVTLRALSSREKTSVYVWGLNEFARRVEKNSQGELRIEWRGGPEAVPIWQGADAVSKGIFDVFHTTGTFYASTVPEANAIYLEHGASPKALRETGAVALLDEIHRAKLGLKFLGISMHGPEFTIVTKRPITSLAMFKGMKIRSTPLYVPMIRALGATAVTVSPVDIYPALQRGIVDAVAWPTIGLEEMKIHEVVKYAVRPFYYALRWTTLMNERAYDQLPPHLQKVLLSSMREVEDWSDKTFPAEQAKEWTRLQQAGVVMTDLAATDGKKFVEIVDAAAWDEIVKTSPKHGPKLKELFLKAAKKL